jgi:hypothetical protein
MRGLRVPADTAEPVAVVSVERSAVALSDLIGGGLLHESYGVVDGAEYAIYTDEERVAKGLPGNGRAAALSARLGRADQGWLDGLRGDVLILGCNDRRDDADVPDAVVAAARQAGLLPHGDATGNGMSR